MIKAKKAGPRESQHEREPKAVKKERAAATQVVQRLPEVEKIKKPD
jgi:hypothetical protein